MGAVAEAEFGPESGTRACMNTEEMRAMALAARNIQQERNPGRVLNARLNAEGIRKCCTMEKDAEDVLKKAYEHYSFSVRARSKIIKVARTIADLNNTEKIHAADIAEAVAYRGVG